MELIIKQFNELSVMELYEILKLRIAVFVVEQNCPYYETDDLDLLSYHVYLKDETGILAYLRVLPQNTKFNTASLGRIIAAKRGCGLGKKIVFSGIKVAREKFNSKTLKIEAQSYAKGFYEKCGFIQTSSEYMLDNIPHIKMELNESLQSL